ncbi:hypothetical protein Micbo1qcDRAFT_181427 [Microdochium bolleyi]|uniref:F-box domain-containing protein n=1 Tax=Microdochium bolleyi TaxID=196109 RepID=A0A136IIG2_9PEZI|nr:hypothetical protein Micbo1qcDRAFT_181427 [Microdochium bolleyi]
MAILSLPTEILQQILALTAGDDYEHLMLTCSRIFRCEQDHLHQHNARRRRWRHIRIRSWENNADATVARSMADWLLGIAAYTEIAQYAQVLSVMLDHDSNVEEEAREKEEDWTGEPDEEDDSIATRASRNRGRGAYSRKFDPGLAWLRMEEQKSIDQGIASSWATAQGAVQVAMESPWLEAAGANGASWLARFPRFQEIVGEDNFTAGGEGVLQLISVRAGGSPGTAKCPSGASEGNVPLAQGSRRHMLGNSPLSSLRDVSHTGSRIGSNVDLAHRYYQNGSHRWPSKGPDPGNDTASPLLACRAASGIEKLDLRACVMDNASMASLVSHMPRPKELRCSHGEQGSLAYIWNVDPFLDAIAAAPGLASQGTIGVQLTSLAIGIQAQDRGTGNIRVEISTEATKSLWKFTALKQLEIDAELLLGPRIRSGTQGDPFDTYDQVPSLISILPEIETLKELILFIGPSTGATAWFLLLDGFARSRRRQLPRLSWITIKDTSIQEEWLRQMEWPWVGSSGGDVAVKE